MAPSSPSASVAPSSLRRFGGLLTAGSPSQAAAGGPLLLPFPLCGGLAGGRGFLDVEDLEVVVRRSDSLLLRLCLPSLPSQAARERNGRRVMHLLLPPPVGDEVFCVGDASTVYEANGGMPLPFCISLLESVLGSYPGPVALQIPSIAQIFWKCVAQFIRPVLVGVL